MERAQASHEALTGAVLRGGTPSDVVRLLADQLGGSVTLFDRTDTAVVHRDSADDPSGSPGEAELAVLLQNAHRSGRGTTSVNQAGIAGSVASIQAGDGYLGALAWSRVARHGASDDIDLRTVERATHVMGLLILKERAVPDAVERGTADRVDCRQPGDRSGAAGSRAGRNIDPDRLALVLVADSATLPSTDISRHLHDIARGCAGLAGAALGTGRCYVLVGVEPLGTLQNVRDGACGGLSAARRSFMLETWQHGGPQRNPPSST